MFMNIPLCILISHYWQSIEIGTCSSRSFTALHGDDKAGIELEIFLHAQYGSYHLSYDLMMIFVHFQMNASSYKVAQL